MRRSWRWQCLPVALLLVGGCGGSDPEPAAEPADDPDPTAEPTDDPDPTAEPTDDPDPTAEPADDQSSLPLVEAPGFDAGALSTLDSGGELPPGVAEGVGIFVGGGTSYNGESCRVSADPRVALAGVLGEGGTTTIGGSVIACFEGFDLDVPIILTIDDPSGGQETLTLDARYVEPFFGIELIPGDADRSYQIFRVIEPGAPIGQYTMTADQGAAHATATFVVEATSDVPDVRVLPSTDDDISAFYHPEIVPGNEITFVLSGWPPNGEASFDVYGGVQGTFTDSFLGRITAGVDEQGVGVVTLSTGPGDGGLYLCAVPEPEALARLFSEDLDAEILGNSWCRTEAFSTAIGTS